MLLATAYNPPPKPQSITRVDGYQIVHWRHDEFGRIYVKDRRGRVIAELHDFDASLNRVIPHGPDGIPEVVLTTWTGGAHASEGIYVIRLGRRPKCLVAYWKNNYGFDDDFRFQNAAGHPNTRILSWYDGLTNDRLHLPIVMLFQGGKFVEGTSQSRSLLKEHAHTALIRLEQIRRHETVSDGSPTMDQGESDWLATFESIEFLGSKIMLGEQVNGWSVLKRAVAPRVYRDLRSHRSWISGMSEYRKKLVRHPTLSHLQQIWHYPDKLESPWE